MKIKEHPRGEPAPPRGAPPLELRSGVTVRETFEWYHGLSGQTLLFDITTGWHNVFCELGATPEKPPTLEEWRAFPKTLRVDLQPFVGNLHNMDISPDWAMQDNCNLDFPLLIAHDPIEPFRTMGYAILIDGWHRVFKANRLGIRELDAVILLPEETDKLLVTTY